MLIGSAVSGCIAYNIGSAVSGCIDALLEVQSVDALMFIGSAVSGYIDAYWKCS